MKNIELVDVSSLQPFLQCLKDRSIDYERYFDQQSIPSEMVLSGHGKIFKRQAWRFFEEVEQNEGLHTLGFLDDDRSNILSLGALGQILTTSVTLKDAIDTFCLLVNQLAEGNTCWLQQGPVSSQLLCYTQGLDRTARVSDHYTTVVLKEVIRLAAGPDWEAEIIWLYTKPSDEIHKLKALRTTRVFFEQKVTGIAFPSRFLDQPIVQPAAKTNEISIDLNHTTVNGSLSSSLQTVLQSLLEHHILPTADEAAEILGSSRTSLYRALATEGSNYRHIIERMRFNMAKQLLADKTISIKSIAFELSYTDPANFIRAFRRLSGFSPNQYRKNLNDQLTNT